MTHFANIMFALLTATLLSVGVLLLWAKQNRRPRQ